MVTPAKNLPAAVFLVGGKGTRLGLGDLPKPMVPVDGVPLLQRMVEGLAAQGVTRFLMLAGHGAEVIEAHFAQNTPDGCTVDVVIEDAPMGTAGSFHQLRDLLTEPFLVVYGDLMFDLDVGRFVDFAREKGGAGVLYVHPNDHPEDSDLVDVDADGRVRAFISKPHSNPDCGNLVNAALYLFHPDVLEYLPDAGAGVVDWGADVLPAIVSAGQHAIYAYRGSEYLKDIGTPKRLERGTRDFLSGKVAARSYRNRQRAIFFDRDGVLNREVNGVHTPDQLELLPGVSEALARVNRSQFLTICVTNQPDIAKGFMSFEDLRAVHNRLDWALSENGGFLDDVFFCPHHPEAGWPGERAELKIECTCRKPAPGMILEAAERHNIDLSASFLIGDHARDIEAGLSAGLRCYSVGGTQHPGAIAKPSAVEAVADILSQLGADQ